MLYFGDNLPILSLLLKDPAVAGKVRLVYIDPPFASGMAYHSRSLAHAYEDLLRGPEYIEFLRERIVLLRELMADDGSIYVHLDSKMAFEVKVVMDEVFGGGRFRNWITRKKCNPKNYTRRTYGNVSDYILFYTKTDSYLWNRPLEDWSPERAAREYQYVDRVSGRRFKRVPLHAPGTRNGETGKPWRGMAPPPGKHWQFPPSVLDEMDRRGQVYWSPTGNPRRIIYLDDSPGVPIQDIWLDCRDAHNQHISVTGYPTEKNPDMIARIVKASSSPGDLVLDCFCGSGTTLDVASSVGRRWIGVDSSAHAIATTIRRLIEGTKPMGDFVGQRTGRRAVQEAQPALFADAEDGRRAAGAESVRTLLAPGPRGGGKPFTLYSSAPLPEEITSLLGL
jgi:adenine-specific DNA-methyltransferase